MAEFHFQNIARGKPMAARADGPPRAKVRPARPQVLMVGMHLRHTRGGITTLTADILNSELKKDLDFTYIASQAENRRGFGKLLVAASAALQFVGRCIYRRPDLVYVHIGSNASLYRESAFVAIARLFNLRVVSHFHAGDVQLYLARQPAFGKSFIRRAIGLSERVIAVSKESANQLAQLDPQLNISIIPNVIDTSAFRRDEARNVQASEGSAVRILFVGAVGKLKGERDLIAALAVLRDTVPGIRASFVGFGAEGLAESCREHGITEMIEHLGPVPMTERVGLYHRADIFVLPTYAEAMPISVIEAMAAGLPVVTTPVGGIPEIVDSGSEGYLVECGNIVQLAEKIRSLATSPDTRHRMGEAGKDRVRKQMDFDLYIDDIRTEINQAIRNAETI